MSRETEKSSRDYALQWSSHLAFATKMSLFPDSLGNEADDVLNHIAFTSCNPEIPVPSTCTGETPRTLQNASFPNSLVNQY